MSDIKNTEEKGSAACSPQTGEQTTEGHTELQFTAAEQTGLQPVNAENLSLAERGKDVAAATQESTAENAKPTRLQRFLQFLKFTLFSASAGAIQLLSTTLLHEWTGWLKDYYYIAYIIGLTLSVIWNFTFNRKFTFKAANNVPIAMVLVIIYNCIIVVPLAFGGDELVKIWGDEYGILVTAISLLINFVTEFFWDKFIVFNSKVTDKILRWFKRKKKDNSSAENAENSENIESIENADVTVNNLNVINIVKIENTVNVVNVENTAFGKTEEISKSQ